MTTTVDHTPDILWDTLQPLADGDVDWAQAICAQTDPEAFFPDKGGSTRDAKRVCHTCPIRRACLEYALTHDERFGIWGGLSERERRALRRGRKQRHTTTGADIGEGQQ